MTQSIKVITIKNIVLTFILISSVGLSQSIVSKIQDLEKRVEKLEQDLLEKTDEISKLKKTNNLKKQISLFTKIYLF